MATGIITSTSGNSEVFPFIGPAMLFSTETGMGFGFGIAVQQIIVKLSTSVQFVKTLNNFFYVFDFGPNPGSIEIRGRILPTYCAVSDIRAPINNMFSYYSINNFSTRRSPVLFAIGNYAFRVFVTELTLVVSEERESVVGSVFSLKGTIA